MIKFCIIVIIYILCSDLSLRAHEPVRDLKEVLNPKPEKMHQLAQAQLVMADYQTLQRDFKGLRGLTREQISSTLIQNTAFISQYQLGQQVVNTEIPLTTNEFIEAHRPQSYGRAHVFNFQDGLIDAKGTGTIHPNPAPYKNGLMTLGEAVREFLFQKMVQQVLTHAGYGAGTVESYGVIDAGFEVIMADGTKEPAGILLRQAHSRLTPSGRPIIDKEAEKLELLLWKYGVISNDTIAGKEWVLAQDHNLQLTKSRAIFDFGAFLVVEKLGNAKVPVDPKLNIPFPIWGYSSTGRSDSKYDNLWTWSHELARNWRSGNASLQDFENHQHNLLKPVFEKLPTKADLHNCKGLSSVRVFPSP